MSLYNVGLVATPRYEIVGAEPQPKKGTGSVLIVLGLAAFVYVVIPGKKGWQRALAGDK